MEAYKYLLGVRASKFCHHLLERTIEILATLTREREREREREVHHSLVPNYVK